MIHGFLLWWGQQLFSLLPARLFGNVSAETDAMLISPVGDVTKEPIETVALRLRQRGKIARLGNFSCDADGLRRLSSRLTQKVRSPLVFLALPQEMLLHKTLVLPTAVEFDLDRVLRYEMDVETPFAADQVYWNWVIDRRDPTKDRIEVSLALLPRRKVDGLLALFHQHGITPQGIVAPRSDGAPLVLPLVRREKDAPRAPGLRPRIVWGLCLLLALIAVALPFLRQSLAGREIDARINALRADAMQTQALLSRLDGSAAGGNVILVERGQFADPLQVLNDLTAALPDDTFIGDFLLKGHKLTVAGQSASATRLIGILSADALFRDPSFAAPVTRHAVGNGSVEVFSIAADVRSEP